MKNKCLVCGVEFESKCGHRHDMCLKCKITRRAYQPPIDLRECGFKPASEHAPYINSAPDTSLYFHDIGSLGNQQLPEYRAPSANDGAL